MIDVREMQNAHREWVDKNFPGETLEQATLGVCEEAGELAHSILKMQQGVRGTKKEHRDKALDAIGDMFIYGLSVCDHLDASMEILVEQVWSRVQRRDWIADPITGGEPEPCGWCEQAKKEGVDPLPHDCPNELTVDRGAEEELEPTARELQAVGWLSSHLASLCGAWDGGAPDWFPQPPEWLDLWRQALAATRE